MSKTQFSNGSNLTANYLNTIYGSGTTGGHIHDSVDSDGHAPQINLQAHVSGILPTTHYSPPMDYINGFIMTWVNSGSSYSITFANGHTKCDQFGFPIVTSTTATMTKNVISASGTAVVPWSPGSNAGGVAPTATLPAAGHAGWLHAFAIVNGSTAYTPDFGFDSDVGGANIRATSGYNRSRRVGSIYITNTAGNLKIVQFLQRGDRFTWHDFQNTLNPLHTAAMGNGIVTTTVPIYYVPPSVVTTAILQVVCQASPGESISVNWHTFFDLSGGHSPQPFNGNCDCAVVGSVTGNVIQQATRLEVDTNGGPYTANNVGMTYNISGTSASTQVNFNVWGYIDRRGKDNQ